MKLIVFNLPLVNLGELWTTLVEVDNLQRFFVLEAQLKFFLKKNFIEVEIKCFEIRMSEFYFFEPIFELEDLVEFFQGRFV